MFAQGFAQCKMRAGQCGLRFSGCWEQVRREHSDKRLQGPSLEMCATPQVPLFLPLKF